MRRLIARRLDREASDLDVLRWLPQKHRATRVLVVQRVEQVGDLVRLPDVAPLDLWKEDLARVDLVHEGPNALESVSGHGAMLERRRGGSHSRPARRSRTGRARDGPRECDSLGA